MTTMTICGSYVDIFPPRHRQLFRDHANPLTDLDEVEFQARFQVTKQYFADLLTARLCKPSVTMVINSLVSMATTSCVIVLTNQMLVYKNSRVIPRTVIPRLGNIDKTPKLIPRIISEYPLISK